MPRAIYDMRPAGADRRAFSCLVYNKISNLIFIKRLTAVVVMANWGAIKLNGSLVRSASIAAVSYGVSKHYDLNFESSAIAGFAVDRFFEHVALNLSDAPCVVIDPNSPKAIRSRLALAEAARPRSREEIAYRVLSRYGKGAMLT